MVNSGHGGDIYRNKIMYDFSANINPLGMPERVKKAASASADMWENYPDPLCEKLRENISGHENISPENILCGCGAADIIYRIVNALRPKKALIAEPTFSEYEKALNSAGCEIILYNLSEKNNFKLECDILDFISNDVDMFFLCTPNNPTGKLTDHEIIRKISLKCRKTKTLLALDMCFFDFTENSGYDIQELLKNGAVIIKAFTKIYAMAGLRLGYMLCYDTEFIKKAYLAGAEWSVSIPAQAAGEAAFEDKDFLRRTVDYISKERNFLYDGLNRLKIKYYKSDANFILLRSEKNLYKILMEKGILIRKCENFHGLTNEFYRIAVRTHEENLLLLETLERGLENG